MRNWWEKATTDYVVFELFFGGEPSNIEEVKRHRMWPNESRWNSCHFLLKAEVTIQVSWNELIPWMHASDSLSESFHQRWVDRTGSIFRQHMNSHAHSYKLKIGDLKHQQCAGFSRFMTKSIGGGGRLNPFEINSTYADISLCCF